MVNEGSVELADDDREELLALLKRFLPGAEVWIFGSRVKGTCRAVSDLDLVVFAEEDSIVAVEELREALQNSNLPFRVDLHVWNELPEEYQENIREQETVRIC